MFMLHHYQKAEAKAHVVGAAQRGEIGHQNRWRYFFGLFWEGRYWLRTDEKFPGQRTLGVFNDSHSEARFWLWWPSAIAPDYAQVRSALCNADHF
jgi:hypothetical protein